MRIRRYVPGTLTGLAVIGVVGWAITAAAQNQSGPSASDLDRAKEMAELVQKGQCSVREATTLAEDHVKGTALGVTASIEMAKSILPAPPNPPRSGALQYEDGRQDRKQPADTPLGRPESRYLVYDVCCFEHNKLVTVRVDGLTRKVIEVKDRNSLDGSS